MPRVRKPSRWYHVLFRAVIIAPVALLGGGTLLGLAVHGIAVSVVRYFHSGLTEYDVSLIALLAFLGTVLGLGIWYESAAKARRRASEGFCARCGYDLRATPARCPECGLVPRGGPSGDARNFGE